MYHYQNRFERHLAIFCIDRLVMRASVGSQLLIRFISVQTERTEVVGDECTHLLRLVQSVRPRDTSILGEVRNV